MKKPESVTQDDWDAANTLVACINIDSSDRMDQMWHAIRAIRAAKDEERTACIITVLSFIEYGGDAHNGITCNPIVDAMKIAAALRKRIADQVPNMEDVE